MKENLLDVTAGRTYEVRQFFIRHGHAIRCVLWVLISAQAAVVAWVARPFMTGDSRRYLELGQNLVAGKGYVVSCAGHLMAEGWRLPGYPLFLAAVVWFFGPSPVAVVLCQMGLYLISIFLLYLVSRGLGETAPTIFLLLCAVYPAVAYSSAQIMSEAVCVFLVAAAFFLISRPSLPRSIAAGLALGAATYCRPNLLPLGLVMAFGMAVAQRKIRPAAWVAVSSLAALLPLASWNYVHFRKFSPLPAMGGSGIPLFYGAWESVLPISQLTSFNNGYPPGPLLVKSGMVAQLRGISTAVGAPNSITPPFPLCDAQRSELADALLRRAALQDAKRWPGTYLWHAARVGVTNWFPTLALDRFPTPLRALLWIDVAALPLLGIIGFFSLARPAGQGRILALVALAAVAYFTASLGWFVSDSRYTVPARLVLLVGAAAFLNKLLGSKPETGIQTRVEIAAQVGVREAGQ